MKSYKICLILFAFILFAASCQSTPSSQVVVNKKDGNLESIIAQEAINVTQVNFPSQNSVIMPSEKISDACFYEVNADVQFPFSILPVAKVRQRVFDIEFYNSIINYFFPGSSIYHRREIRTKSDYEREIVQMRKYLAEYSSDMIADEIQAREKYINELEVELQSAPEIVENIELNFDDLLPNTDFEAFVIKGPYEITLRGRLGGSYFHMLTGTIQTEKMVLMGDAIPGEESGRRLMNVQISESAAIDTANKLLSELGIYDLNLVTITKAREINNSISSRPEDMIETEGYYLTYMRSLGALTTIDLGTGGIVRNYEEPATIAPWGQERIRVFIDHNGVRAFLWDYASEVVEVENTSVQILPFDQIVSRLKQQLKYRYAYVQDLVKTDPFAEMQIKINSIRLGLSMIGIVDKQNYCRLIPAWYVLYDEIYTKTGIIEPEALIFNAIDGSQIEPRNILMMYE